MLAYNRFVLVISLAMLVCSCSGKDESLDSAFTRSVLFSGPEEAAPWAKFTGDLNSDGLPELYVGYHGTGEVLQLVHGEPAGGPISRLHAVLTDGGIADLNSDGTNDIVLLTQHGLFAFYGPESEAIQLFPERFHDVRFLDEDDDGQLEILVRDQTAFGNGSGELRVLTRGEGSGHWNDRTLATLEGEGIAIADLDGDGDTDIAVASVWLENRSGREWATHAYSNSWDWPHAKIVVSDVDGDGANDIVLAPAELESERYRISWFKATENPADLWTETVLVDDVETIVHGLQAGDVDLDGDLDIIYAEMHQGQDPDEVVMLENRGKARAWRKRLIDNGGSHNLQLFDWDSDGDLDIAGANWDGEDQDVVLWTNHTCDSPWSAWERHEIDGERPGQAVFVLAGDLNNDSFPDVVSGSIAYLNPGMAPGAWRPVVLGPPSMDAAGIWDFNSDGVLDVLVAVDEEANRLFVILENDGTAKFHAVETGAPLSGDFLQGISATSDAGRSLALSWHEAGVGIELLQFPTAGQTNWTSTSISEYSQDEDLSSGDIDGDGDVDILLGTSWLRKDLENWSLQSIDESAPAPDRNELADLDGDGDLDVVVGFEAISSKGDIAWYEAEEDGWIRHSVASIVGPMSLDVADMDDDGDLDIIAGEHNLENPDSAGLWIFENIDGFGKSWDQHRIHVGDEHHDGAQTVDIDLDGDLDIVSIGWGHDDVIWYENRMPTCPNDSQAGD